MIIDSILCFSTLLVLQLATPWWWWIMVVPFVFGILRAKSGWYGFLLGTYTAGALWLVGSVYYYLSGSQVITQRVADILNINTPLLLIFLTAVIAAFAGGIAGTTGYALKKTCIRGKS